MDENELIEKLAKLDSLLHEKKDFEYTSRINTVIKLCFDAWALIDPVTGIAGVGAKVLTSFIDGLLSKLNNNRQHSIDEIVTEVFEEHHSQLMSIEDILKKLIPHASLCFDADKYRIFDGHGISSVTDCSSNHVRMNLTEPLYMPDIYIAMCNVVGAVCEVNSHSIDISFPTTFNPSKNHKLKVMLTRMSY
jgi:hypothetical protein